MWIFIYEHNIKNIKRTMVADIFSPSTRLHSTTSPSIFKPVSSLEIQTTNWVFFFLLILLSLELFSFYHITIIISSRIHHTIYGGKKACYASLITKIKHFFCSVEQWLCTVDKKILENIFFWETRMAGFQLEIICAGKLKKFIYRKFLVRNSITYSTYSPNLGRVEMGNWRKIEGK